MWRGFTAGPGGIVEGDGDNLAFPIAEGNAGTADHSEMPMSAARLDPAASITARTSSIRCSNVRSWDGATRSESPVPACRTG
jgi:hypothetical protein